MVTGWCARYSGLGHSSTRTYYEPETSSQKLDYSLGARGLHPSLSESGFNVAKPSLTPAVPSAQRCCAFKFKFRGSGCCGHGLCRLQG